MNFNRDILNIINSGNKEVHKKEVSIYPGIHIKPNQVPSNNNPNLNNVGSNRQIPSRQGSRPNSVRVGNNN